MRAPETSYGDGDFYMHPTDGRERKPWNPGPDNGKCAACIPGAAIVIFATAMAVAAAMNDKPNTNTSVHQIQTASAIK